MPQGFNLWKSGSSDVLLEPDNLFWSVSRGDEKSEMFIPARVLSFYEKVRDDLSKEMNDFRFGQDLTAVYIDPTDKCNADCSYCYISPSVRKSGRSMTAQELNYILDKIALHFKGLKRKQVIIFHASEPLLVKDIIFPAIKKYKNVFKFGIQTNAILMEKKDVEFLKKHFVGVGISLDSFSQDVNNRMRPAGKGTGNFNKAVQTIEWFDGYKGLNVITTVTKHNVKDLPALVKFLHAKKVSCVLMNPVRFTRVPIRTLKPDDKTLVSNFIKAVDASIELSSKSKHKIIIGNFTNTVLAIIAPVARRLMCDISPCGGGRCFFTITAAGHMIPCGEFIGMKNFSAGSIFKKSIAQAMRSDAFKRVRARAVEKISECDICAFRNICGAPCPAELESLGNMYQKSVFCNFYKQIIQYAFKMIAQDKVKYLLRDRPLKDFYYEYKL